MSRYDLPFSASFLLLLAYIAQFIALYIADRLRTGTASSSDSTVTPPA